jgi:hypothetical protein
MIIGEVNIDRRMVSDCSIHDWMANQFVAMTRNSVILSDGFYSRRLKVPITRDRKYCLRIHQIYAGFKYQQRLSTPEFIAGLDEDLPEIKDGIVFNGPSNHWHFLVDGLGSLGPLENEYQSLYVDADIAPDKLEFLREYCHKVGYRKVPDIVLLDHPNYRVRNCAFLIPLALHRRIQWARQNLAIGGSGPPTRLFVSRSMAQQRRVVNSEAIESLLRSQFGFDIVYPEKFSIQEQARMFANAEAVVGPHGAALANAIFSSNLRVLGEFYPETPQPFYSVLAQEIGAAYFAIAGARVSDIPVGDWRRINADFMVDESEILKTLERYLQRLA